MVVGDTQTIKSTSKIFVLVKSMSIIFLIELKKPVTNLTSQHGLVLKLNGHGGGI